jgi:hypothetical protein
MIALAARDGALGRGRGPAGRPLDLPASPSRTIGEPGLADPIAELNEAVAA